MKFSQFDNEHVAQAWERMKSMIKNCPTHGLTSWMIVQTFYAGLNFSSRNLLDSVAGGTFMSLTLGAATKLLDNMMVNDSEWHTERAPQGAIIDMREGTIKYQFPLKKGMEQFPRKRKKFVFDSILRANYELDASSLDYT
jgi:hypothetical protein